MLKPLLFVALVMALFSCQKQSEVEPTTTASSAAKAPVELKATNTFKGVNWADARDNFQTGWVLPSGVSASDSYSTILSHGQTICSNFQSLLGANTVRIPINPPTVNQWWSTYKAVVDAPLALGMKVIIGCWCENGTVGYVTDWTAFMNMWTTVINSYGSNANVYFEILNEPHGYSTTEQLIQMYASWLSTFSSVPRGRVLCGGTGYSENVNNIGGDSRLSGCLFSQHDYAYWNTYTTNTAWYNDLNNRCGSYTSRTIVTEVGCTMTSGLKFYGASSTNNEVCYFQGMTNYTRAKSMGLCYWPGLRDGDSYSMCGRSGGGYTLYVINSDAVNQLKWGWGL